MFPVVRSGESRMLAVVCPGLPYDLTFVVRKPDVLWWQVGVRVLLTWLSVLVLCGFLGTAVSAAVAPGVVTMVFLVVSVVLSVLLAVSSVLDGRAVLPSGGPSRVVVPDGWLSVAESLHRVSLVLTTVEDPGLRDFYTVAVHTLYEACLGRRGFEEAEVLVEMLEDAVSGVRGVDQLGGGDSVLEWGL